jgi:hypothetical protein
MGRSIRRAGSGHYGDHLGKPLEHLLGHRRVADRLLQRHAWQPPGLERDDAFIEARDELRAHEQGDTHARGKEPRSHTAGDPWVAQRARQQRAIDALRLADEPRPSSFTRVRRKMLASRGITVKESTSEPASAKTTVSAIGRNIFPSTPWSVRIGR